MNGIQPPFIKENHKTPLSQQTWLKKKTLSTEVLNMTNEENFVEEQDNFPEENEISADDFMSGEGDFIKSPEVGESVEFILKTIKKQPAKKVKNPKTGKNMDVKLSSVDYYYDFVNEQNKALSVTAWQIIGKTKAIMKKLGGKYGFQIKIEHAASGLNAPEGTIAWKVYAKVNDTYKELDKETNKWI